MDNNNTNNTSSSGSIDNPTIRMMNNTNMQKIKRRRVTRACDECRKKKVKCDGQQPCIHCTVYSYECTYNQPTKRSNNTTSSTTTGITTSSNTSSSSSSTTTTTTANNNSTITPTTASSYTPTNTANATPYAKLQMDLKRYKWFLKEILPNVPDLDHLDVVQFVKLYRKNCNKNNASSIEKSPVLSTTIAEYFQANNETPISSNSVMSTPEPLSAMENIDGSISSTLGREIKIILPPKQIALEFLKNAWDGCCVLLRFYHRPTFLKQLDELYEVDPENYSHAQMQFLPLCYSTLAVGALFSKSYTTNTNNMDHNNFLQDEGYKYFIAARKLIDITNARDLNSIQSIIMLFIFLQCSARLSTCYSYLGVAMRSALRDGLHRAVSNNSLYSPIHIEMSKRIFYTIYKLDVYVNSMLGLPRSISPEDFDQVLPFDLSDENITETEYLFDKQNGVLSSSGIANEHTKLIIILDVIIKELYPIKKTNTIISHETVTNLEIKLQNWITNLPIELKPGLDDAIPPKYEKANRLLHLSFLHVQTILYRPFIHYLSTKYIKPDALSLQRAKNSINVARTVIKIAQITLDKNILSGAYWYGVYTIFFSVAGLLFYIHEVQPTDKASAKEYYELLKDAEQGRSILLQLKDTSMAAGRTYNILNKMFEKLNSKTIRLTLLQANTIRGNSSTSAQSGSPRQPATDSPISINMNYSSGNSNNKNSDPAPFKPEKNGDVSLARLLEVGDNILDGSSINSPNMELYKQLTSDQSAENESIPTGSDTVVNGDPLSSRTPQVKQEFDDPFLSGVFDQLELQLFDRLVPNASENVPGDTSGSKTDVGSDNTVSLM